jgi:hypothetical protein
VAALGAVVTAGLVVAAVVLLRHLRPAAEAWGEPPAAPEPEPAVVGGR